jgi:hypothetical protein
MLDVRASLAMPGCVPGTPRRHRLSEVRSAGLSLALGISFASCLESPVVRPPPAASPQPEAPAVTAPPAIVPGNVVLVTLDGVRWQEIFTGADPAWADGAFLPRGDARTARGLTPNLHRLFFDQGTVLGDPQVGEPFAASGPNFVSLPGYVEIMTGAVSGCFGNECEPRIGWAVAGAAARSTPDSSAAVFASWERIDRTVPAHTVGLTVHAGRGAGDEAPPYPGIGEYLPDLRTAPRAIDYLVHHRPRFMWVALGDTDEWAHRRDYRGYIEALHFADDFIGELVEHLADMGDYGAHTSIFVTTDHGRDPDFCNHGSPASSGVWLMARGGAVVKRGVVPLAHTRHLRDIAPTMAVRLGEQVPRGPQRGEALGELL